MNNDLITLIVEVTKSNSRGFPETTVTKFPDIFANVSDVKRTEFYTAASANIRVSLSVMISTEDWKHCYVEDDGKKIYPSKVEFEGMEYEIIRHYRFDEVDTELVLKEVE